LSVKEIQFLCGQLDFKHLIGLDLSKMRFYRNSATCSLCIMRCSLSRTMRSAIVKTMFYSYGVAAICCVGFNSVLITLRNLSSKWYIYSILSVSVWCYF